MVNNLVHKNSPTAFKILVAICFVILVGLIISFFRRLEFSQNNPRSIIQILVWFAIGVGIFLKKKWAWAIFFTILIFSIINIIHSVVAARMNFDLKILIPISIGAVIIWLLNMKSIRNLFQIDYRKNKDQPLETANFSIFCFALGLFILFEILGIGRNAISTIPAKLFLGFLGSTFLLIGFGIWKLNKYAFLAALSFLIFTVIALTIILLYDLLEVNRFLALPKFLFYIALSCSVLFYWLKFVRPKLPKEEFSEV